MPDRRHSSIRCCSENFTNSCGAFFDGSSLVEVIATAKATASKKDIAVFG
jgi:hypothetical protein